MSKVERRTMLVGLSNHEDRLILQNPRIKKGASIEIARGQIAHSPNSDIELRIIGETSSLVVTPEYLRGVRDLDSFRRGEHIIRLAKNIRSAKELVFTRRKTK